MSNTEVTVDALALAQRMEAIDAHNNAGYAQSKAQCDPDNHARVVAVGDGLAVYTGPGSPINRVYALGMSGLVTPAFVREAEDFFHARGAPATIDLCPLADRSLVRTLRARAYSVAGFKHVFQRNLLLPADWPVPASHVRVEVVDQGRARLWAETVAGAFSGRDSIDEQGVRFALPNVSATDTRCYLAWIDDVPAGGGAMTLHDGVAICYSTSVRPALRRMGVQTALLFARLTDARRSGADLAVIQTAPGSASERNVLRFGFKLAYTKPTVVESIIVTPESAPADR